MASKRIDLLCEPCLFVDEKIEAIGFCLTCSECLCSTCIKEHRKAKATRNHEVRHSIPENVDIIRQMNEMLACPVHAEMNISYRCNDHATCMCSVCRVDTHRNCVHVFDITKSDKLDIDTESVEKKLEDLRLSAVSLKGRKGENRKVLCQIDEELHIALSDIDKDIETVEVIEQSAKKNAGILEAAKKYGDSASPLVIGYKLADDAVIQQNLIESLNKKKDHELLFMKNEDCSIQVSSPGTISLHHKEVSEIKQELCIEKTSDEVTECEVSCLQAGKLAVSTATRQRLPRTSEMFFSEQQVIDVSVDTDNNYSSIYGILVLTDERLLMIDYNNSNIKLFSSDYMLLDVLRLPGRPVRLCFISENVVAVSFERVKRINRYNVVGTTISYDGGFSTTLFNQGIGFDGSSIVAIMCDEDISCDSNAKDDQIQVEFRNPYNGKINGMIKDFKVVGNKTWSLTLNNTQALQFTEDAKMIIAEQNRLSCFTYRGESWEKIAIQEMFYVCHGEVPKEDINNIAVDSESVFVCTKSGSVLQLSSSDFSSNRIIVPETDESFTAIAVDSVNGRLILGCEKKDYILVYELKRKV